MAPMHLNKQHLVRWARTSAEWTIGVVTSRSVVVVATTCAILYGGWLAGSVVLSGGPKAPDVEASSSAQVQAAPAPAVAAHLEIRTDALSSCGQSMPAAGGSD